MDASEQETDVLLEHVQQDSVHQKPGQNGTPSVSGDSGVYSRESTTI